MSALQNDLLLRALLREDVPRTPTWIMRQAGRYLPEYRATRARAGNFLTLCKTPELACEVTMQPLARFPLDAAILFSDILTIPDALGLGLYFTEGEGPKFERPLRSAAQIDALPELDIDGQLRYVTDATRLIRQTLNGTVPLIGFSGSPWTLMTYMVEGQGSKDFRHAKTLLGQDPAVAHRLLSKLATGVTHYLNAQIEAGAQAVMIFDTWGGILSPAWYREFSLQYMARIVDGLQKSADGRRVPNVLFTKNGGSHLSEIAATGCDAAGVDWTCDLATARAAVDGRIALQGNLDPSLLHCDPDVLDAAVQRVLASYGHGNGHVFNLGHGITPQVPPEHLGAVVQAVREHSPQYHRA